MMDRLYLTQYMHVILTSTSLVIVWTLLIIATSRSSTRSLAHPSALPPMCGIVQGAHAYSANLILRESIKATLFAQICKSLRSFSLVQHLCETLSFCLEAIVSSFPLFSQIFRKIWLTISIFSFKRYFEIFGMIVCKFTKLFKIFIFIDFFKIFDKNA